MPSPSLQKEIVARFLLSGGYDRYLKRLRANLATQVETVRQTVFQCFSKGTRISRPAGGHMLWTAHEDRRDAAMARRPRQTYQHLARSDILRSRTLPKPHSSECGNRAVRGSRPRPGDSGTPLRRLRIDSNKRYQSRRLCRVLCRLKSVFVDGGLCCCGLSGTLRLRFGGWLRRSLFSGLRLSPGGGLLLDRSRDCSHGHLVQFRGFAKNVRSVAT